MIVNKLGAILRQRKCKPTVFAELIGRKRQWVYSLCKEDTSMTSHTLNLLCAALEVQPGDLQVYVPDHLYRREGEDENEDLQDRPGA